MGNQWLISSLHLIIILLIVACSLAPGVSSISPYIEGTSYWTVLTPNDLDRGVTYLGSAERLKVALANIAEGKPTKVVTLGGSITAGQGCMDTPTWPQLLQVILQQKFGTHVKVHNGGISGTVSAYMASCVTAHAPKDAQVVFVEYTINDSPLTFPILLNDKRRAYERLLRKLLDYPLKPAVILVHSYLWYGDVRQQNPVPGQYWNSAEREFGEFASYYNLPQISIKACCYHKMQRNVTGFRVDALRKDDVMELLGKVFYWDRVHPDGRTGARVMAELASHLFFTMANKLRTSPLSELDKALATEPIPPPLIPRNHHSSAATCLIGDQLQQAVVQNRGFSWINEGKGQLPKWGYVATEVGAQLLLQLNTMAASIDASKAEMKSEHSDEVNVEIAYLRSYVGMGMAKLKCEKGCRCVPLQLDAYEPRERVSLVMIASHFISQSPACLLSITVDSETRSTGHKFKVTGIIVSEQAGSRRGSGAATALEYVTSIAARGGDGVFETSNHVHEN